MASLPPRTAVTINGRAATRPPRVGLIRVRGRLATGPIPDLSGCVPIPGIHDAPPRMIPFLAVRAGWTRVMAPLRALPAAAEEADALIQAARRWRVASPPLRTGEPWLDLAALGREGAVVATEGVWYPMLHTGTIALIVVWGLYLRL